MGARNPWQTKAVPLALAIASSCSFAGTAPTVCPDGLLPTSTVPPLLPKRTEIIFEGTAELAITINQDGRVSDPELVSNHLSNRLGGAADKLDGALLLAAVSQWRYSPRKSACRKQVTIVLRAGQG